MNIPVLYPDTAVIPLRARGLKKLVEIVVDNYTKQDGAELLSEISGVGFETANDLYEAESHNLGGRRRPMAGGMGPNRLPS